MASLHFSLRQELAAARLQTDALFALLRPGALRDRPVPERHRLLFYLGHLEAFDWNLLGRDALQLRSPRPELDRLFAFGIDPPPGQLPNDQPSDWPAEDEVRRYCASVRQALDGQWDAVPTDLACVALEHRLMHAETLAYLLHNLPHDRKLAPEAASPRAASAPPSESWCAIPAGVATLGRPRGEGFGWDNEYAETRVPVPAFSILRHKVTNAAYLRFVEEGGPVPHFWVRPAGQWLFRGMFSVRPLAPNEPAYVTQAQATAYAAWRGVALPTEAQFHRAAYGSPDGTERPYPWGSEPPSACHGSLDFQNWDPVPVDATPAGDSAFGLAQTVGNGWEWTGTPFCPLPGFQPFDFYPGYSADFFDGQHYVLKGGSPRTAARLLRRSFRNWFRPSYPHVYAGFRCVERNAE